jgi:hypothetical protein
VSPGAGINGWFPMFFLDLEKVFALVDKTGHPTPLILRPKPELQEI